MNQNEILVYSHLKQNGFSNNAIAAIMGVVGGESAFTDLLENSFLGTTNSRLRIIFPTRLGSKSDAELNACKASDYSFFNCVYGGSYGNSPTEGYKYRGRGFNGITFKGNYIAIKDLIQSTYGENYDLVNNPELLERPEIAVKALAVYFRMLKGYTDFEPAFQEAFRQNAGPLYTFAQYEAMSDFSRAAIALKREKAEYYRDLINQGAFPTVNTNISSGIVNSTFIFPLLLVISFGGYYLYKKFKK